MGFAFTKKDFDIFNIDGLEPRMKEIRAHIQPKFRDVGNKLVTFLNDEYEGDFYLHIAKHARRKVNPPKDTWLAISQNKRGYKKHPHFQVGLFDDRLFIFLAFINELADKPIIAKRFKEHIGDIKHDIPGNYLISTDHTKKDMNFLSNVDLESTLHRFETVKKGEFLIGQSIAKEDIEKYDDQALFSIIKSTYKHVFPLYRIAQSVL